MKHFFHTFTPLLKQMAFMLLSLGLVLFVMLTSFGSCSNQPANQGSTANNQPTVNNADEEETSRRRSDSSDDDEPEGCDDDEGDPCKDDDDCEDTCAHIYAGKTSSITSCKNRGDETVGKLEEIHDILMGYKAGLTKANGADERSASKVKSDLAKIKDDDEDVDHDDLKCYLQIGSHKYIREIKKGLRPSDASGGDPEKRANLIETLKWLVDHDQESAEVIADLSAGDNILEELLLKLNEFVPANSYCLSENALTPPTNLSENKDIWKLNGRKIEIYQAETGSAQKGVITLDNDADKNTYDALSCIYTEVAGIRNIFSYSAEEENEHIFDLAFGLLRGICEDVKNNGHDEDKGCARAMMCWTAWRDANSGAVISQDATGAEAPSTSEDNDLWKMAKNHESQLEPEDGGSDYKDCEVRDFADFF